jgi:3-oxoacyl-[acyl-carrier protein] reductase
VSESPFDFTGRAALVTGCGSAEGIGFACARMLARLGARVAITSTTERIVERAAEIGGDVSAHVADLTDHEQALALVEAAGDPDVLVNSAGLAQTGVHMPFPRLADMWTRRSCGASSTRPSSPRSTRRRPCSPG